uniref:NADH-ubiquinone oxidoreductase chain 4 n=1 Tax=Falcidens halanychi TaxID=370642 RepID=A0A343X881_9MOLL|nr:NADH dehydrogenase subunit 4 [Falcidens halanychi]AWH02140.1 NADH dehydrogenase subunit 4 [Falcidens halanychi]
MLAMIFFFLSSYWVFMCEVKGYFLRVFFLVSLYLGFSFLFFFLFNPGVSMIWGDGVFFLDSLSIPLVLLTCWISSLMLLCSGQKSLLFFTSVFGLNFFLVFFFLSQEIVMFYIFFEGALIPTMFLILKWGVQPERLQAGMYLMIYTVSASLPLFLVIMHLKVQGMGWFMDFNFESNSLLSFSEKNLLWGVLCLAFLVKLPMFPLHLWLPKAHVEAPIAGSMILAAILLKMGGYGLLRFSFFLPLSLYFSNFLFLLGSVGGMITSLICLRQTDVKCLVAYSSVGHMGLMLGGIMSKSVWGFNASLSMMVAHGLCSSGLFALANHTYMGTHTRSLYLNKGAISIFPAMSMWWFLLCVCNMGAPPSLGLFSEILLFTVVISFFWGSVITVAALAFFAACYNLYLFCATQHGKLPSFQNSLVEGDLVKAHLFCFLHWVPLNLLIFFVSVNSLW